MNKDGRNLFVVDTDDLQVLLRQYELFYSAESEDASEKYLDKYLGLLKDVSYDTYCVWEIVKEAFLRGVIA